MNYLKKVIEVAKKATCTRAQCGAIIVQDDEIIGEGFNSPPQNLEGQRRCSNSKDQYDKKVTDKTCCIHAEQRAVMDALKRNPKKLSGSRLYFIRLDKNGEASVAGDPYCTICSKMVLDVGVTEFVLWHEEGPKVYRTNEYNDLSYDYES